MNENELGGVKEFSPMYTISQLQDIGKFLERASGLIMTVDELDTMADDLMEPWLDVKTTENTIEIQMTDLY